MGLAFVPFYIQYLGMEAYGLIGLFAVMQAWLTLLDMGMTPTLNREMARYTAGIHDAQSIRDLLRTLEIACFGIALLIGIAVWAGSGYLASHWLNVKNLAPSVVGNALSVIALVISLRFIEGIYRGALIGLQRQVWFNSVNAVLSTLRWGGSFAVLALVSPTIEAFFLCQAFASLLSVVMLGASVHRILPRAARPARFSRAAVAEIWKFAGGMVGITILALLLEQIDKVMLSRLLSLETFGYYSLAATLAGTLYMAIYPIITALFPRMVELSTLGDRAALASVYHQGAQLVSVLTAPAAMLLCFFAAGTVYMWTGDAGHAERTAPILSALVLGSFLHGLMAVPYQSQVASGWTSLTIKTNAIAVLIFVPAIFWIVPRYGAIGAAWIWVVLNIGYVIFMVQFMHRRILPGEKRRWYIDDVLLPTGGAFAVMLVARQFMPADFHSRLQWLVFLFITGCLALAAAGTLANRVRSLALTAMSNGLDKSAFNQR